MMSTEDLSKRAKSEQEEAKQEHLKEARKAMEFTADFMTDMWLRMWNKLTKEDKVPAEIAKNWMDCWIHHSLVSSHNNAMAEKMHGIMVQAHRMKQDGPEFPDKEF